MPDQTSRSCSVLTIGRGRADHLRHVIAGLARQDTPPDEVIVGVMQQTLYDDLPDAPFPIRQIHVSGDALPLAKARNAVAAAARAEVLIFLDIDCIPAPTLVSDYRARCELGAGLMMGEVLYLPAGEAVPGWTFDRFDAVAVRHSDRQGPPAKGIRPCEDYRCFWSLNFGLHRDDWAASGGFDEVYTGYGAEDTDFGRTLDARGIPISWIAGARVYHQHHDHCMPPIHHVPSILRNAEIFADKWGHRTMGHWLHAFSLMGLVRVEPDALTILREPDEADFALCRQQAHMPYAATARVIRELERRERERLGLPDEDLSARDRHARMTRTEEDLIRTARTDLVAE